MSHDKGRTQYQLRFLDMLGPPDGGGAQPEAKEPATMGHVQPEAQGPVIGCQPEPDVKAKATGTGKTRGMRAVSPPAPAKPPEPAPTYTYPFHIRYMASPVDLVGFVDGQAYTAVELKDVLVHNGFTEFKDIEPDFHHNDETNTLVITIRGSKKGAGIQIGAQALRLIEAAFKLTYATSGTEDRLLIYRNASTGAPAVARPEARASRFGVECDMHLAVVRDGQIWDLAFDLHSHHVLGAYWSSTDNWWERLRGITYGVFSWKDGQDIWLFRQWDGHGFIPRAYDEVVASAEC